MGLSRAKPIVYLSGLFFVVVIGCGVHWQSKLQSDSQFALIGQLATGTQQCVTQLVLEWAAQLQLGLDT